MFGVCLLWFVVFGKFENAQFEHTKERSSVTPVSRGSGGSPTTSASDHVNRYNGLTPFYAILNGTVTPINDFKADQSRRKRHDRKNIYSDWSNWSFCSEKCTTVRRRRCVRPKICGSNVVTESSYCFTEDSKCPELVTNSKRSDWSLSNKVVGDRFVSKNLTCGSAVNSDIVPVFKNSRYLIKIMGGQESEKFRWPWQVAVLNGLKEPICGGTIIAPGWILTAAHCSRHKLYAVLREYDLSVNEGDEIEIRVERVIVHPGYNPNTIDNDVALLKLRTLDLEINGGYDLEPACLPVFDFQQRKRKPKTCVVIGWGKVHSQDFYGSQILREARVPIVGQRTCRAAHRRHSITDNMFCAGYRDGRADTCAGDSGGPLMCRMRGRWTVVGVTSFGDGCGRAGKYGVYASVANHVRWMRSVMNGRLSAAAARGRVHGPEWAEAGAIESRTGRTDDRKSSGKKFSGHDDRELG